MKTLDKGQDKVKKIADRIREEVLEPSRKESEEIIKNAKQKADEIIENAEKKAQELLENAKQAIQHERNVFYSSLSQSSKQTIESLKQSIEKKLFNDQLESLVKAHTSDPQVLAKLIKTIIDAIEKEGLSTEISAVIPKGVSVKEVNQLLGQEIINKLQGGSVEVGEFAGGAKVKLMDKQLTLDISDQTLVEYLRNYVRKDFRKLIFIE